MKKIFLVLAMVAVAVSGAFAGSPPVAVDATASDVFFIPTGAAATDTTSLEYEIAIKGKPFSRAYLFCDIDSSADMTFSAWKMTISGTDTTWSLPWFFTLRGDTLGTIHKGAKFVLWFAREVDAVLITDGEGSVTCE